MIKKSSARRKSTSSLPLNGSKEAYFGRRASAENLQPLMTLSPDASGRHRPFNVTDRVYIKEGRVTLYEHNRVKERYLFLFNDLLLVAKEKASTSYRLKERVRLCEVWIAEGASSLNLHDSDCSLRFIIGWPIKNYVAEFKDSSERDIWWRALKSQIDIQRAEQKPRRTHVDIVWKTKDKTPAVVRSVAVSNTDTAADVASKAAQLFGLTTDPGSPHLDNERWSSPATTPRSFRRSVSAAPTSAISRWTLSGASSNDEASSATTSLERLPCSAAPKLSFQLLVQSGKESTRIPLEGHECVLAIVLHYVHDLVPQDSSDLDLSLFEDSICSNNRSFKCTFFLRPRPNPALTNRQRDSSSSIKKIKRRSGAGHLVSNLKRKVMKQMSHEGSSSPGTSPYSQRPSEPGLLFGRPLAELVDQGNNNAEKSILLPKPLMDMIKLIYREGIGIEGIFRKAPNYRILKEVRRNLDQGVEVDFNELQPTIAASLLKEFLRMLPDSVIPSGEFALWMALCDESTKNAQIRRSRELLQRMPPANFCLLRCLICLLYHITQNEHVNHMNSYNLSVCVAPSLMNSAFTYLIGDVNARKASELLRFLIDEAVAVFGDEIYSLLGETPNLNCSKVQSDDEHVYNIVHPIDTSSVDSLMGGASPMVFSSRPHSATALLNNNAGNTGNSDKPKKAQGGDGVYVSRDSGLCEDSGGSNSLESCATVPVVGALLTKPQMNQRSASDAPDATSAALGNLASARFVCANNESSADSLYESIDSACSLDDTEHNSSGNIRRPLRNEPSLGGASVATTSRTPSQRSARMAAIDRRHAFRQKSKPPSPKIFDKGDLQQVANEEAPAKPPRRKKLLTRTAPQVETTSNGRTVIMSLNDTDELDDIPNVDDEDQIKDHETPVKVLNTDMFKARPVLIRCNSSSDSSSDDSLPVVRKNSIFKAVPVNTTPELQSASILLQNLNEIKQKVSEAQLKQKMAVKSVLSNTMGGKPTRSINIGNNMAAGSSTCVNDSSTVTEASSSGETTPHVSRESSRANDYKNVAQSMFGHETTVATPVGFVPQMNHHRPIGLAGFRHKSAHLPCLKNPTAPTDNYNINVKSDAWRRRDAPAHSTSGASSNVMRRWRRKTLGADEFESLAARLAQTPLDSRQSAANSVRDRVSYFDRIGGSQREFGRDAPANNTNGTSYV